MGEYLLFPDFWDLLISYKKIILNSITNIINNSNIISNSSSNNIAGEYMAYKIPGKKNSVRTEWNEKQPEYVTEMKIEDIRKLGGSQRYGEGADWVSENLYHSVGGYQSRGGMPFKLRTKDGDFPISPTDVEMLMKNNIIKPRGFNI